jgi:hypothetical protein
MAKLLAIAAAFLMCIPAGAFAKEKTEHKAKTEHSVRFYQTVEVGSAQLKPGTYKVEWAASGTSVPITFTQDGKTVLTTQGHIVEQSKPADADEIVMHQTITNQERLEELIFGHRREALSFTPTSGM